MPQRPLITFEYVIQNFDLDQDDIINNGPMIQSGSNITTELNNNHLSEQNGLHQIKIVRSSSNVGENRQNYLTSNHQQPHNYTNQTKNVSTTEIWHHGPR